MRSKRVSLPCSALIAGAALSAAACSDAVSEPASVSAALTAEQCEFFQVDGKIQICHKTGSAKKPYTILKVATEACVDGHAAHDGDYVAVDDPDCKGLGCFPVGAPVDGTVPCCEGLVELNGHCACPEDTQCTTWSPNSDGTCSPTELGAETMCDDHVATTLGDRCDGAGGCAGEACEGASCQAALQACASAAAGEALSLDGVSFTVPAGSPAMTLCRTTSAPPETSVDGAFIDARSAVYEFSPSGPLPSPVTISFAIGSASDLTLFWAEDGINYAEPDAVSIAGGVMTYTTHHFSRAVASANNCPLASDLDKVCGTMPTGPSAGPCSAEPTCQQNGSKLKCKADFQPAGTVCRGAADLCDAAETCNGSGKTCPADVVAAAGTECRPAIGGCDVSESCDGVTLTCPADTTLAAGTSCDDADVSTFGDHCDGSGTCTGTAVSCPASTECTPSFTMNGTSTCVANHAPTGTPCSGGECDGGGTCKSLCYQTSGCGGQTSMTDPRDGKQYPIVQIGTQCWLAKNLDYGTYVPGHNGPQNPGEKYCPGNQTLNNGGNDPSCPYGGLYDLPNLSGGAALCNGNSLACPTCSSLVQGLCPPGWHLPSHNEWLVLEQLIGGDGNALKSTTGWLVPSPAYGVCASASCVPTNTTGFSALPAGQFYPGDGYGASGIYGYFWTASGWARVIYFQFSTLGVYEWTSPGAQLGARSARCVKD